MPYTEFHYTPTGTGVISGKEVLEQTEDAINDLGGQISGDVQTAIDTANNALNTANTASADAQNAVNTANTAYTAATNAQNTANAAQTTATNAQNAATAAQNDVDALENVVTGIDGRLTTTEGNVTNLTTRMGTAEGNITTLQNDVITAQGTATSAQNTATLARGQAYVVRYASVAVSDNSTVPYTDLNNVDNVKANDLLLDINGKIYQISAVDTATETVSVTVPLTQLAVDSSVVHKSGNETVAGIKTFSGIPIFETFDAIRFRCTHNSSAYVTFRNLNQSNPGSIIFSANDGNVSTSIHLVDKTLIPYTTADIDLGTTLRKWKSINGINPGALSLPDLSNGIDISGYINTGDSDNSYTPLADGYISVRINSTNSCGLYASQGDVYTSSYGNIVDIDLGGYFCSLFIPVIKNVACRIVCRRAQTIVSAKFIPCLGNV